MHKLKLALVQMSGGGRLLLFFWDKGFEPLSFHSEGIFSLESCDSVWKICWSVSIFMRNSLDSSFGIPILILLKVILGLSQAISLSSYLNLLPI